MADEDDETPPETEKEPTEFAFREFGHVLLTTNNNDAILPLRNNLLDVANIYGLAFVGYPGGFKVYKDAVLFAATDDKQNNQPEVLVDVPLKSPPHWLAVSSDNLTLTVCASGEKGLLALFFDTRNLVNKGKPTKTPFCVFPLSKSPADSVRSLHWNPSAENCKYLAICLSSGVFYMLAVTDIIQELGRKESEFGACSVCWSPRGKQVIIGKRDGSMQQYTPALEVRRTVPVYNAIEASVRVDDILWLSTLQVAFTYIPDSDGDSQSSLFIVNLPPSKDLTKAPSFRNYEDPCYGVSGSRPPHLLTSFIDKWNLFVVSSSEASETAVIAKDKQKDIWEIWNLDGSCRAQLPMEKNEEPSPLGVAILYTARKRIVVDETTDYGPMPVFMMLSCDGHLSMFHMINLQSQEEYPNVIIESKELSSDGERAVLMNKLPGLDSGTSTVTSLGKPKLSSKPSVLVTSTPKQLNDPALRDNQQVPAITALRTAKASSFDGSAASPTTTPFAPKALNFTNLPTPIPVEGPSTKNFQKSEALVPSHGINPLPGADPKPKPTLGKTFSLAPVKENRAPLFDATDGETPGISRQFRPDPNLHLDSSISSLSTASIKDRKIVAPTQEPNKPKRRSTHKKQEEKLSSIQSSETSGIMDGIAVEVTDFEQELSALLIESSSVTNVVASLGSDEEKVDIKETVEETEKFLKEIVRITREQHEEIQSIRNLSLEAYAAVQNVETHRKRVENPAYRDALYTRPLDMSDQRKLKDIRVKYQRIKDTIREVNAVLDSQWNQFMQGQKFSPLQKSKRRMELEERNTVHHAITTQTKILHQQEMKLLLLNQELDRLRLLNSTCVFSDMTFSSHERTSRAGAGDSADLPALATSLIRKGNQIPEEKDRGDAATKSGLKKGSFPQISPKKACQLAEFLASRKTKPVRSLSGSKYKSRFIAPVFRKPSPEASTSTAGVGSRSSRLSSQTSEYSNESEDTITSAGAESSEDYVGPEESYLPGYKLTTTPSGGKYKNGPMFSTTKKVAPAPTFVPEVVSSVPFTQPATSLNIVTAERDKQSKFVQRELPIKAPSPQRSSIEGSSTITYGGPENRVPHTKPVMKFDVMSQVEAASNLNNPPQVINIKEMKEPSVVNVVPFSQKFEAKAEVPSGVVHEVQKVLDAVHAERSQVDQNQVASMSMLSRTTPTPESSSDARPAATFSQGFSSLALSQSSNSGTTFGLRSLDKQFTSPFTMKIPAGLPGADSSTESTVTSTAETKPTSITAFSAFGAESKLLSSNSDRSGATSSNLFSSTSSKPQSGLFTLLSVERTTTKTASSETTTLSNAQTTLFTPVSSNSPVITHAEETLPEGIPSTERAIASVSAPSPVVTASQPVGFVPAPTPVENVPASTPVVTVTQPTLAATVPASTPTVPPPASAMPNLFRVSSSQGEAQVQQSLPTDRSDLTEGSTPPVVSAFVATPVTSSFTTPGLFSAPSTPVSTQVQTPVVPADNLLVETEIVDETAEASVPVTTVASTFGFGALAMGAQQNLFGDPSASTASAFGQGIQPKPGMFSQGFNQNAVSDENTSSGLFRPAATTNAPVFGTSSGFGSAPASSSTSSGFGGGFLSGLGSTPQQASNANPFAAASSAPSSDNKSLFGNTTSSPFSSGFGQTSSASAFGSNSGQSATPGFGAFAKPTTGGFGAAAFGSPPAFGAKPAFGAPAQFGASPSFGASTGGFGSPASFGGQTGTTGGGFGSSSGFSAFASSNTPGFGSLAEQSGGGFGSLAGNSNQPSFGGQSGFGSGSTSKPSFTGWR